MNDTLHRVILAIDPGPDDSAFVVFWNREILDFGKDENETLKRELLPLIEQHGVDAVVFEKVEGYGRPVGAEVFETVFWTGRFWNQIEVYQHPAKSLYRIGRKAVKLHLCGNTAKITDPIIRQRIIDLYGPGREKAIGTKKKPGPLYGIKKDCWAALAVAITFDETHVK